MRERESVVIVVGDHEPVYYAPDKKRSAARKRALRWPSRAAGLLLTLLVHALISAPIILGGAPPKKRQSSDGAGTTAWASPGAQAASMTLIDLSALTESADFESPASVPTEIAIAPEELRLLLASAEPTLPPVEASDDETTEANDAAGDPAGQAALFGKYMGQVSARIERAWMRPRSSVEGGHFECRARIAQDKAGNVLAVSLLNCSSNADWRRSLVAAILRASPLSAPPQKRLFADNITLSFAAEQYVANRTPEYDYEPEMRRVRAN